MHKGVVAAWTTKSKACIFVLTPYGGNDVWGAIVGTNQKDCEVGKNSCHVKTVAWEQDKFARL